MLRDSNQPPVKLILTEPAPILFLSEDLLMRVKRWAKFCLEQEGITQAWIGKLDENNSIQWVTGCPADSAPESFPGSALEKVVQTKEIYLFRNHDDLVSGGLFPLRCNGQMIGALGLLSNQTDYFKPGSVTWITALTTLISENLFDTDQIDDEQQVEHEITRILQSSLDVRDHLPKILEILASELKADVVTLVGYVFSAKRFELIATDGLGMPVIAKLRLYFEAGLAGKTLDRYHPVWIEDLRAADSDARPICRMDEEGFRGYLALPLTGHNDLTGVIEFFWHEPKLTTSWNWYALQRIAEQMAFAIQRSGILKDMRQRNEELLTRYNAMIEGLSRALELRDIETEGHTRRVSQLTIRLVEHMKLSSEQWDSIRQGALLHDIGKLGIPDAILLKPGSLSPQERKVMQQHVLYGYNILAPIISARHTLDIALYHHEHWDGKGYPYGLKGEQIPLVARLFTIIDVFDALKSDRPYRSAWSHEQVLQYLRTQAGHEFDPYIVKLFLEIAGEMV